MLRLLSLYQASSSYEWTTTPPPCSSTSAFSLYERTLPAKYPLRINATGDKANALRCLGRLNESLALYKSAMKLGLQVFKKDSEDLLVLEGNMAITLCELGKHEEAAEVYDRVIEARERSPLYGPSDESTWGARSNLGIALVEMGRLTEAIPLLRDSLAAFDGMGLGPELPQLGVIPQLYGRALLGADRAAEAVPMFQRSITFRECKFGLHHHLIPGDLHHITKAFKQLGRGFVGERLSLLDHAVAIHELSIGKSKEESAGPLAAALRASAECCEEAGRLGEAVARWAKIVAAVAQARRFDLWFFEF